MAEVIKVKSGGDNYVAGAVGRVPATYAAVNAAGEAVAYYRPAGPAKGGYHRVQARCWWGEAAPAGAKQAPPCFSLAMFRAWAAKQA